MTTIIIIALIIALCLVSAALACMVAMAGFQRAEIKALREDNELCADEIERLNQHIVELMPPAHWGCRSVTEPVDESPYFDGDEHVAPREKAPVFKLFDVNKGDKNG